MAWIKKYQIPFQSLTGTQYMVYIYEKGSSQGSITTLTAAADPFVTQEDNSDDIFTPIRKQTGYLRVIDETNDGTLLETLIPTNNTEKMVKLYTGTWDSNFTTFTDGDVAWQGFLCAEAFTQPWDNQKKVIEFPVNSMLTALEDVQIPDYMAGQTVQAGQLLISGVYALCGNNVSPFSRIYTCNDLSDRWEWAKMYVNYATFFHKETIENQNESTIEYVGVSYLDAIQYICELFGLTAREYGNYLILAQYDKNGYYTRACYYEWSGFIYLITTGGGHLYELGVPEDVNMLNTINFVGSDNTEGFVQGARSAKVKLKLGGATLNVTLPATAETADAPVEKVLNAGTLYVQPHGPRTEYEVFSYFEYKRNQLQGTSDYESTLNGTVINGYYASPYYDESYSLYTGAFPIRWFYRENTEKIVLKNGLYLNTQYRQSQRVPGSITYNLLYQINSPIGLNASDGWIRIDFKWLNIIWNTTLGKYLFTDAATFYGADVRTEVRMCLRIGNKWWNGSGWVDNGSAPNTYFWFHVFNDTIETNKTPDMNIDEDGGYFIPVTENLNGNVSFYILNAAIVTISLSGGNQYQLCYSHILHDLSITHVRPISIVASERDSNTYRTSIAQSGFGEDKEFELTIGTNNNNKTSPCLITSDGTELIEAFTYKVDSTTTADERPEMHLLSRMATQYNQVRRTFYAIIRSGIDIILQRFVYSSRKFFGVSASRNWRDDKEEVKFIEVT